MKNYWGLALTISVLFHAAILGGTTYPFRKALKNNPAAKKESKKELKMVPGKIEKIVKKQAPKFKQIKPLPYIENIMNKLMPGNNFSPLTKQQIFKKSVKEIIFSEIPQNSEKLKENPAYMNYYRMVRERIRTSAYHNYGSNKKGEVLLNFRIARDGSLKGIGLSSGSVPIRILRNIAIKSIRESAPFPAFPAELSKYSHLKFNISIYFKN